MKAVTAFLRAAALLDKLEHFQELLEEHDDFWLSDRRHMSDIIPFISSQEYAVRKKYVVNMYWSFLMARPGLEKHWWLFCGLWIPTGSSNNALLICCYFLRAPAMVIHD